MVDASAMRNLLSDAYKAAAAFLAGYTVMNAAGSPGTEPAGGSPAYARKSIGWGSSTNGVVSGAATLDIPSGTTIVGVGYHSLVSAGVYYDKTTVTSQAFASQGTLTVTSTYTQT